MKLTVQGQVPAAANKAYHNWLEDVVISKLNRGPRHELEALEAFAARTGFYSKCTPSKINKLRKAVKRYIAEGGV